MPDLKVALIQTALVWEDVDANLTMLDKKIGDMKKDCDLIVLPEMFSTGFSMNPGHLAESMNGRAVSWMIKKAEETGAVITGSVMTEDNDRFYNRLIWAQPDGNYSTYDKKHLFRYAGEDKVYTAGKSPVTLELSEWRIRPFICYDLRFPIWTRNLDLEYDLSIFVANWPARRSLHWRSLLRARAIENQSYVIGVNRVGVDGNNLEYAGHTSAISPLGEILCEEENNEIIQTVTLSKDALESYRKEFPAWMDADKGYCRWLS